MASGYSIGQHMPRENLQAWEDDREDKGTLGKRKNLQYEISCYTGKIGDKLRFPQKTKTKPRPSFFLSLYLELRLRSGANRVLIPIGQY